MLLDANGQEITPKQRKISDNELIGAFTTMENRIDTIANQQFIIGVTIDFLIRKLNSLGIKLEHKDILAVADDQNAIHPLAIIDSEFEPFMKEKYDELMEQLKAREEAQVKG